MLPVPPVERDRIWACARIRYRAASVRWSRIWPWGDMSTPCKLVGVTAAKAREAGERGGEGKRGDGNSNHNSSSALGETLEKACHFFVQKGAGEQKGRRERR